MALYIRHSWPNLRVGNLGKGKISFPLNLYSKTRSGRVPWWAPLFIMKLPLACRPVLLPYVFTVLCDNQVLLGMQIWYGRLDVLEEHHESARAQGARLSCLAWIMRMIMLIFHEHATFTSVPSGVHPFSSLRLEERKKHSSTDRQTLHRVSSIFFNNCC